MYDKDEPEEKVLLSTLQPRLKDAMTRRVYADWLLEHGDRRADLLKVEEALATHPRGDSGRERLGALWSELVAAFDPGWIGCIGSNAVVPPWFARLGDASAPSGISDLYFLRTWRLLAVHAPIDDVVRALISGWGDGTADAYISSRRWTRGVNWGVYPESSWTISRQHMPVVELHASGWTVLALELDRFVWPPGHESHEFSQAVARWFSAVMGTLTFESWYADTSNLIAYDLYACGELRERAGWLERPVFVSHDPRRAGPWRQVGGPEGARTCFRHFQSQLCESLGLLLPQGWPTVSPNREGVRVEMITSDALLERADLLDLTLRPGESAALISRSKWCDFCLQGLARERLGIHHVCDVCARHAALVRDFLGPPLGENLDAEDVPVEEKHQMATEFKLSSPEVTEILTVADVVRLLTMRLRIG